MRRLCTLILAGAAIAFSADAAEAQLRLGVKGGVSFSDVDLESLETVETSNLTGFIGGAELQIPLGGGFALQPEVLFARKGTEVVDLGEARFDYVEIPLLLRFNIPAPVVTPFLYAGGAVAFEAKCELAEGSVEEDCDADIDDPFETESTDFGVLFGGGIAFPAGPGDLFIEGRFNVGLRDIDTSTDTEAKHRSGAAMIGYSFSLGPIG